MPFLCSDILKTTPAHTYHYFCLRLPNTRGAVAKNPLKFKTYTKHLSPGSMWKTVGFRLMVGSRGIRIHSTSNLCVNTGNYLLPPDIELSRNPLYQYTHQNAIYIYTHHINAVLVQLMVEKRLKHH